MTDPNMAQRLATFINLVPQFENALRSFQSSGSKFRVLKTVHPKSSAPLEPKAPPPTEAPKTLFILDSSFNPPSIAHRTLAQSALSKASADRYAAPYRLLLLFSTMNADKAPSPASFSQRLGMMTMLARDLLDDLAQDPAQSHHVVPIDIAVTTAPYYTDKSRAIETEGSALYVDQPKHIHLLGFDTFTRFFTAKYYSSFNPPFSALNPYFDEGGHQLRVMLRPDDSYGSEEEQQAFLQRLRSGEMEGDGAKREWAQQVEFVPPNPQAGVSSTKIRKAAEAGLWDEVKRLCTHGVADWVQHEKLYEEPGGREED